MGFPQSLAVQGQHSRLGGKELSSRPIIPLGQVAWSPWPTGQTHVGSSGLLHLSLQAGEMPTEGVHTPPTLQNPVAPQLKSPGLSQPVWQ